MKKIMIFLFSLILLTGCSKKETIEHVYCSTNDDTLGNLVKIELELRNDKLYFMRQTQVIEYETTIKATEAATNLEANSYLINDTYDHIKAKVEVEGTNVLAITEHEVSKFNQTEKDAIALTDNSKAGLISNFEKMGYKCSEKES